MNPKRSAGRRPPARATASLITRSPVSRTKSRLTDFAPNKVPVFLIEDNRLLRAGLTAMLSAQGLQVVATARSGGDAMRQVARLKPQVVLLDSAIGDRDSLRLVRAIKKTSPAIKVIVMHLLPTQEEVIAFVHAGVSGFIMKDASMSEFVGTIRAVADGASVLPEKITGTLFAHVASHAVRGGKRGVKAAMRMTKREHEVTALIAEGFDNREIGKRLRIAAHTVKSHVHNILEKLALRTRLEVATYANMSGNGGLVPTD